MIWWVIVPVVIIALELLMFRHIKESQCPKCGGRLSKVNGWDKLECSSEGCTYTISIE